MSKADNHSFWISYSDLATGLMMVFLLLMVVLMAAMAQMRENEAQSAMDRRKEMEDMVDKLSVVLGLQPGLADELKDGFDNKDLVDPVTAQLRLEEDHVKFQRGEAAYDRDKPGTEANIKEFGSNYVCALWHWELDLGSAGASPDQRLNQLSNLASVRLNPLSSRAVQRIYVVGNADLQSSDTNANWILSSNRARLVHNSVSAELARCASDADATCFAYTGSNKRTVEVRDTCREYATEVWNYAQERLYAVGAGHIEHCRSLSEELSGDCVQAGELLALRGGVESDRHRNVSFEVELTNSDLTGLLSDVYLLQVALVEEGKVLGLEQPSENAQGPIWLIIQKVAPECWPGDGMPRKQYAACQDFAQRCDDTTSDHLLSPDDRKVFRCDLYDAFKQRTGAPN